jgi:hypothetical protein
LHGAVGQQGFLQIATVADALTVPEGFEKGHAQKSGGGKQLVQSRCSKAGARKQVVKSRCSTLFSLLGCVMLEAPPLQQR